MAAEDLSGKPQADDEDLEMPDEVQFTLHVGGASNAAEELAWLEEMREAFERCNMANPCESDDSSDGEMITA